MQELKEMNPNTPTSYDEIAEDAIRCWKAGAGATHAHNTSFDLLWRDAHEDYLRTWQQVLDQHPDIPWYPTTCNNLRLPPGEHLRHAMHYVNRRLTTPESMWDSYLIGDYGLTAMEPIATNGVPPTLESLYSYLHLIEQAQVEHPWYVSIWGQGALDDTTVLRRAIALGGHTKTGLELFYDPARNPTDLELLQQAQEVAREVGRPIATHQEARELYRLT